MKTSYQGLRIHWAWHDTRNDGPRRMAHDVKARTVLWIAECQGVARLRGLTPAGACLVQVGELLVPMRSRDVPAVALGLLAGTPADPARPAGPSAVSILDLVGMPPADLDGVDVDALLALQADDTLVTVSEIGELLGVNSDARRGESIRWWRTAQRYLVGGHRDWPPTPELLQSRVWPRRRPSEECVTGYPFHSRVLPPPSVEFVPGQPRWALGEIRLWAMSVGRMDLGGEQVFVLGPWGHAQSTSSAS